MTKSKAKSRQGSISKEAEDWRSTCPSPRARMLYALETGFLSDVSFLVGVDEEVIQGHRETLSLQSLVFQAMLTGKSFENPIQIRDVQPCGFKPLLKYLYTDGIPEIPDEDYMEFFRAVKFFKVEELIEVGRKNILEKLGLGNALNVFVNGKLLDEKELEEAADEFIKKNAESILAQPKFSELSNDNLLHFISSDDFSAPEVPLCRAVHKWGEAECERQHLEKCPENLRLVLKKMVPQIRFPLMNSGDFALEIAKLNVLTLEETVAIHNYFFARHHQRHQIPEGGRFISKPRKYVNYYDADKVDNIVMTRDGIDIGLRFSTVYTISNKGGENNFLFTYSGLGVVATKNFEAYGFGGANYLSTFWLLGPGSKANSYTFFAKSVKGYLTWVEGTCKVLGPEGKKPTEAEDLTFEAATTPGYFMLTSGMKKPDSDKPLVLARCGEARGDGCTVKFIEKPEEEVDTVLWTFQKIK